MDGITEGHLGRKYESRAKLPDKFTINCAYDEAGCIMMHPKVECKSQLSKSMYTLSNSMVDENDHELKGFLENGSCFPIVSPNNNFLPSLTLELFR